MVKNDSAKRTRGCKTTIVLVQMTASGKARHNPTEKDLIFAQPHIKKKSLKARVMQATRAHAPPKLALHLLSASAQKKLKINNNYFYNQL